MTPQVAATKVEHKSDQKSSTVGGSKRTQSGREALRFLQWVYGRRGLGPPNKIGNFRPGPARVLKQDPEDLWAGLAYRVDFRCHMHHVS